MHLIYFDENKYSEANPFFTIGGVLVPEAKVLELDETLTKIQSNFFGSSHPTTQNEFHGKEMFHGKGPFKGRKLAERVQLFDYLATFLVDNAIPIQLIHIDVNRHRSKYTYPEPEYRLGLMLFLERACDYLDSVDDLGIAFGDYEQDEVARSVVDFSEYKTSGKTPMHYGRPLGRLVDTVYFTQSHHSRFLQLADVVVYMAGRYLQQAEAPEKWHDARVWEIWEKIKASADMHIQHWP
ncbi:hypothetical protein T5B8_01530 [Salinisphaera sp. T5B8]|uniref:DUF3800 domain-containing protein n=1 Tax=unclassified Salinisphaera TaxID=2649847 RepID=UPI00333FDFD3